MYFYYNLNGRNIFIVSVVVNNIKKFLLVLFGNYGVLWKKGIGYIGKVFGKIIGQFRIFFEVFLFRFVGFFLFLDVVIDDIIFVNCYFFVLLLNFVCDFFNDFCNWN